MPTPLECSEIDVWQALLGDTAPPEQRQLYEAHLESCPACRERIDQTLIGAVRQAGNPATATTDPTLAEVLERLHEVGAAGRAIPSEPLDLYFLSPGDRPGVLGTLGGYEVREVIGQGGMGIVLKAFDPALHRLVAIKVLAPALAGSATARRRFTREAQAAAAVCHEHLVAVHGVHEADGLPYLVMQYVAGESLQDRLDRTGPLPAEEVVRIGLQAASGLAAAHAQGLIHRDVKPANLLLENGPAQVKITDFGLARTADEVPLTRDGVVSGTPEYMAPEQARGEAVDHRADLFSLGSVLYACCTGAPPFRGPTPLAVLRQVNDQAPVPVRELNPDVPAWLEALIDRLLAKEPGRRLGTAAAVAALLEGYLAHLRQPATVPAPLLPPPPAEAGPGPSKPGGRTRSARRLGQHLWLPALVLLAAFALGMALLIAGAVGGTRSCQTYYRSLKGKTENSQGLELTGPDADECVYFEPEGLRITLPAGYPGKRVGTGVATTFPVKGDFEITVDFEILKEPDPAETGQGTGVFLGVDLDTPENNRATLTRGVREGKQLTTWFQLTGEGADKPEVDELRSFPSAGAARGRLRLVRAGATLSHYAAEGSGEEFLLLRQHPFAGGDVRAVRVGGSTGGPAAALDARVTDLHIRADSLPGVPDATATAPNAAAGRGWPMAASVVGLAVAFPGALGVWLYLRRRRGRADVPAPLPVGARPQAKSEAAPPPVAFPCSGCGKRLKAAAELAGKKVKCPRCGQAVVVAAAAP